MTHPDQGGGSASLPWASVFDPAVNVRAMGEIQERGFRAATELVNRFVRMADSAATDEKNQVSVSDSPGSGSTNVSADVDRILGVWHQLAAQFTSATTREPGMPRTGYAGIDFVRTAAIGHLVLDAAAPGPVTGEMWLHNTGGTDLGKVRLRCSDLMSNDGTAVAACRIRIEPDEVALPDRSSRGVTVEVDLPDDLSPGRYRGSVMIEGHDEVWLPMTVCLAQT